MKLVRGTRNSSKTVAVHPDCSILIHLMSLTSCTIYPSIPDHWSGECEMSRTHISYHLDAAFDALLVWVSTASWIRIVLLAYDAAAGLDQLLLPKTPSTRSMLYHLCWLLLINPLILPSQRPTETRVNNKANSIDFKLFEFQTWSWMFIIPLPL